MHNALGPAAGLLQIPAQEPEPDLTVRKPPGAQTQVIHDARELAKLLQSRFRAVEIAPGELDWNQDLIAWQQRQGVAYLLAELNALLDKLQGGVKLVPLP